MMKPIYKSISPNNELPYNILNYYATSFPPQNKNGAVKYTRKITSIRKTSCKQELNRQRPTVKALFRRVTSTVDF